jgi:hypothetical protein
MKMRSMMAAALAVASLGAAGEAAAGTFPLFTKAVGQFGNEYIPGLQIGLDFLSNKNTQINGIGAYTNGGAPISVALWDLTAGGPAIVTSTIHGLFTGANDYRYVYNSIPVISLVAGDTYQIEATGYTSLDKDYNSALHGNSMTVFHPLFGAYTYLGAAVNTPGVPSALTPATGAPNGAIDYGAGSITSVPEPAIWLMMIAGIGVMGGALRARRRTDSATLAVA